MTEFALDELISEALENNPGKDELSKELHELGLTSKKKYAYDLNHGESVSINGEILKVVLKRYPWVHLKGPDGKNTNIMFEEVVGV